MFFQGSAQALCFLVATYEPDLGRRGLEAGLARLARPRCKFLQQASRQVLLGQRTNWCILRAFDLIHLLTSSTDSGGPGAPPLVPLVPLSGSGRMAASPRDRCTATRNRPPWMLTFEAGFFKERPAGFFMGFPAGRLPTQVLLSKPFLLTAVRTPSNSMTPGDSVIAMFLRSWPRTVSSDSEYGTSKCFSANNF